MKIDTINDIVNDSQSNKIMIQENNDSINIDSSYDLKYITIAKSNSSDSIISNLLRVSIPRKSSNNTLNQLIQDNSDSDIFFDRTESMDILSTFSNNSPLSSLSIISDGYFNNTSRSNSWMEIINENIQMIHNEDDKETTFLFLSDQTIDNNSCSTTQDSI
jgi:hypothetical protein